jgi:hypothetical protein
MQQTFTFDLGKFKTNIYYLLLFQTTGQLCGGFGWESDQITLKLSTMFDFQDCYKTMISDLCDWSNTFNTKDSKWIDSCSPSTGSSLVTIKNWQITNQLSDQSLLGGTVANGKGCWQFAQWTKWTPYVAQMGFELIKKHVLGGGEDLGMSLEELRA